MKVLIACEFSGRVRDAFTLRGHDAWSCDILPTESAGQHYQDKIENVIKYKWDLLIAHPPCQYLSFAANGINHQNSRVPARIMALGLVLMLYHAKIPKICIENPVGFLNRSWQPPSQTIHPWFFGDPIMKRTCLWLKGLPLLQWQKEPDLFSDRTSSELPKPLCYYKKTGKAMHHTTSLSSAKKRSVISKAIAQAMADQWG